MHPVRVICLIFVHHVLCVWLFFLGYFFFFGGGVVWGERGGEGCFSVSSESLDNKKTKCTQPMLEADCLQGHFGGGYFYDY